MGLINRMAKVLNDRLLASLGLRLVRICSIQQLDAEIRTLRQQQADATQRDPLGTWALAACIFCFHRSEFSFRDWISYRGGLEAAEVGQVLRSSSLKKSTSFCNAGERLPSRSKKSHWQNCLQPQALSQAAYLQTERAQSSSLRAAAQYQLCHG